MTGREVMTQEALLALLVERFGEDPAAWAFVCPSCGDVATVADFREALAAAGSSDTASQHIGQVCIGRIAGALLREQPLPPTGHPPMTAEPLAVVALVVALLAWLDARTLPTRRAGRPERPRTRGGYAAGPTPRGGLRPPPPTVSRMPVRPPTAVVRPVNRGTVDPDVD